MGGTFENLAKRRKIMNNSEYKKYCTGFPYLLVLNSKRGYIYYLINSEADFKTSCERVFNFNFDFYPSEKNRLYYEALVEKYKKESEALQSVANSIYDEEVKRALGVEIKLINSNNYLYDAENYLDEINEIKELSTKRDIEKIVDYVLFRQDYQYENIQREEFS